MVGVGNLDRQRAAELLGGGCLRVPKQASVVRHARFASSVAPSAWRGMARDQAHQIEPS
jgi:hypothetical protein